MHLGIIHCEYDSGTNLARKMLDYWDSNINIIKYKKMEQKIEQARILQTIKDIEENNEQILNNPRFILDEKEK